MPSDERNLRAPTRPARAAHSSEMRGPPEKISRKELGARPPLEWDGPGRRARHPHGEVVSQTGRADGKRADERQRAGWAGEPRGRGPRDD